MARAAFEQVLERLQVNPVLPSFALMHELGHVQLQQWRQIGAKGAKAVKQTRKQRRASLTGAIRAAKAAGMTVSGATMAPDGSIVLTFGDGSTATSNDNPWDKVLRRALQLER